MIEEYSSRMENRVLIVQRKTGATNNVGKESERIGKAAETKRSRFHRWTEHDRHPPDYFVWLSVGRCVATRRLGKVNGNVIFIRFVPRSILPPLFFFFFFSFFFTTENWTRSSASDSDAVRILLSQYCTIFFFHFFKFFFNFNKVLAPIYYITMFHSTPRNCKYINTYM